MKEMKIEIWDIERLFPYELNSKKHEPDQIARIAKSLQLGWDQPIVVDAEGVIIKGHGRRLAAISMGLKKVPVLVRADLTPDQVRAARLADNRVAISSIDSDLMKKELATLDFDLEGIFDAKELRFLEADLGSINIDAFVDDINVEVDNQAAEANRQVEETDNRQVKIDKVLGFKSITGSDERHVARFMGLIESETGKVGAEAFVEFVKGYYAKGGAQ